MARLYNLARMTTATTGTGTISLGSAVTGFISFVSAGVQDGETITYAIQDGSNSEIGRGVYTASGTTLTRSVLKSTNSNSAINLSGTAQVFITPSAEDFRDVLIANRTYYVRTDGSDTNTGLANTSAGAFLTIQQAINTVLRFDLNGYNVTIQVADGTYTGGVALAVPFTGSGNVTIQGNSGTPANVIISPTGASCVSISNKSTLYVKDLKVQTTTSGYGLASGSGATLYFGNIVFGTIASGYDHIYVASGSYAQCTANYSITGNARYHMYAFDRSGAFTAGFTVTLTGTPAFTIFAVAEYDSVIQCHAQTFTGSATGTRFYTGSCSTIYTGGGGASYLPGNASGVGTNPSASPYGLYS